MTDKNIPIGIDDGEVEIVTLLDENDNEVASQRIKEDSTLNLDMFLIVSLSLY